MMEASIKHCQCNNVMVSVHGSIMVVAYNSGIGVNLCDEKGHTIRQLAYYLREADRWYENDGTSFSARKPMSERKPLRCFQLQADGSLTPKEVTDG